MLDFDILLSGITKKYQEHRCKFNVKTEFKASCENKFLHEKILVEENR